ncbi:hypothetical protein DASC09_018480 [Saccharomycopsis crataegensis]|uniref:beta-glucosidase n=1 Tax=Saccharomycopsis crataegensis TaxID=43959 RepID=A0AAV5QIC7_9ASCO|nr:hypothetical protein DASC09_018480 [Saccharomycopsis crataegensis]
MTFEVEQVLPQLTKEEKIALTSGIDYWRTFPIHRLGVPSIKTSDGPNGIRGCYHFNSTPTSCFPVETALGSTWDLQLIFQVGQKLAKESRAKLAHVILGPTLNIQRIPNGGRGFESFAEDPVLAGELAAAYINGFQESGLAASLKHFVCNDQENDRFSSNSIVTDRALREIYLKAFEIAITKSNPKSIMTSYNKVNGIHVSENPYFLEKILRNEWGWDGLIMSDWTGTYSTSEAINAGLDLEMPGPPKWRGNFLNHSLFSKKVSLETLDERARNVLNLVKRVERAGILEDLPELNGENQIFEKSLLDENGKLPNDIYEILRKAAADASVLLKNDSNILPFSKSKKTLVIGPNAKYAAYAGGGSSLSTSYYTISPLSAIQKKIGKQNVCYEIGAHNHLYLPSLGEQLSTENGQTGATLKISNESFDDLHYQPFETLVFKDISYFRMNDYKNFNLKSKIFYIELTSVFIPADSGVYEFGIAVCGTAKLYIDDVLIIDNSENQIRGESFYGLGTTEKRGTSNVVAGRKYQLRIEFGSAATSEIVRNINPEFLGGGGLRFGGIPVIDSDKAIRQAVESAKKFDQVVVITGLNKDYESEGADRNELAIPGLSNELITKVTEANSNTVVWIQSGTPIELPWESSVSNIFWSSYGGTETGSGIADTLFGDVNPSGKLPLSFPKKFEDTPSFINNSTDNGRVLYGEDIYVGYRYYEKVKRDVLFPFGHGLSYTTFQLSDLQINVTNSEKISVSVKLQNTGAYEGADVIQLYIGADSSRIKRPLKELKAFQKRKLLPGESCTIIFELESLNCTAYWDEVKSKWASEKGIYTIYIGNSSKTNLEAKFEVKESHYWISKIISNTI